MIRFALLISTLLLIVAETRIGQADEPVWIKDVVYGRKFGLALTLDVIKPAKPNGIGIIFVMSGAFVSDMNGVDGMSKGLLKPFTERGDTIFFVGHGSQPKFIVSEIVADLHRSVRFIRHHAAEYEVDPNRLGISGISSGAYLSLAIGTQGNAGDPKSWDVIERVSSRVQAVACFCPPSDFVDYGKTAQSVVEYEPVKFVWHAFGVQGKPHDEQLKILKDLSPVFSITKETPPVLVFHGDADLLVPFAQSERLMAKLEEYKIPHQFEIRKGAGHSWPTMGKDCIVIADWFEKNLVSKKE